MSFSSAFIPVLNQKVAANRETFNKNTSKTEVTEDGARLKLAKGHIIEAKGLDALQFFSTHHDYRKGEIFYLYYCLVLTVYFRKDSRELCPCVSDRG